MRAHRGRRFRPRSTFARDLPRNPDPQCGAWRHAGTASGVNPRHRLLARRRIEGCPRIRSRSLRGTLLLGLSDTAGDSLTWDVNSRHHQAIHRLGDGLRISARDSEDGTIEAVERPDKRFVVGVQWHPENMSPTDPSQAKLFQRVRRRALGTCWKIQLDCWILPFLEESLSDLGVGMSDVTGCGVTALKPSRGSRYSAAQAHCALSFGILSRL